MRGYKVDWRPLPSWVTAAAPDLEVAAVDRLRSLSGLRVLMALHAISALQRQAEERPFAATCSIADIRSYSSLSLSAVQKGIRELVENGLIQVSEWEPQTPVPRTFVLLSVK